MIFKSIPKEYYTTQGHQYALTVANKPMNYTTCILLCRKEAVVVVHINLVNVYSKFSGSHKILSHNGTEFKN